MWYYTGPLNQSPQQLTEQCEITPKHSSLSSAPVPPVILVQYGNEDALEPPSDEIQEKMWYYKINVSELTEDGMKTTSAEKTLIGFTCVDPNDNERSIIFEEEQIWGGVVDVPEIFRVDKGDFTSARDDINTYNLDLKLKALKKKRKKV